MSPWWLLLLLPAAFWFGFLTMALLVMSRENDISRHDHFPKQRKHKRSFRCF